MKNFDKLKIGDKEYYSILLFMELNSIRSRSTVFHWVRDGKAIVKKIGSNSYFAMV